jgi:ubiquinone biosynthesis protein
MQFRPFYRKYRNLKRYRQIIQVLFKYGFGELLDRMRVSTYFRLGKRIFLRRKAGIEKLNYAQRIRLALEELGPTFVKLGQVLSTRPFLLPLDLIVELTKLQDEVAPFPFPQVKEIVERELKTPIHQLFSSLEETPIASASLSQVHKAITKNGEEVVVKVQRPGIKKVIESDMSILSDMANLLCRYVPESRQYDPKGLVEELARTTHREIDFQNEGRNIEVFASNFKGDETIFVPKVYWNLSTPLVLTMEYIEGIKISNISELEKRGIDKKVVAKNGAHLVLKQIFEHGFFHADPHPGNLFVLENNVIAPIDYGMMGKLSDSSMEELSDLFISVVNWDPVGVVKVYQNVGVIGEETNVRALESEIADFLYRYHKIPLSRIDMKSIINDAFEIIHKYNIKIQAELMLFGKAIITYEEVARMLDPQFDMVTTAIPYARKLATRKFKPRTFLRDVIRSVVDIRDFLTLFPFELRRITQKLRKGELSFVFQHKGLDKLILEIDRASNRLSFSLIIAAIIVGSSLIMRLETKYTLLGYPLFGVLGYIFAGILGVWLVIAILRSGRL